MVNSGIIVIRQRWYFIFRPSTMDERDILLDSTFPFSAFDGHPQFLGGDSHRVESQCAENQQIRFCKDGHPQQKIRDGHRLKRFGAVDGGRGRPGQGCHLFAAIVCRILQAQFTAADRNLVLVEITNCLEVSLVTYFDLFCPYLQTSHSAKDLKPSLSFLFSTIAKCAL